MSAASSIFLAWLLVHALNTISFQRSFGFSASSTGILQHVYDAGHCIALGLLSAGLCGIYRRRWPGQTRKAILALLIGAWILGAIILPPELKNMSSRLAGAHGWLAIKALLVGTIAGIGAALPLGFALGRLLARPYWRWLGVGPSVAIMAAHGAFLPATYHGVHLFMVLVATTLFAASLTGAIMPDRIARYLSRPIPRSLRLGLLALGAAFAAFAIGRRPPPSVAIELVRTDIFLLPHYLLRFLHPPTPLHQAPIPEEMQPWFVDRTNHPPIAPTTPPVLADNPLVIFLTIDCLRADVVMSGKYDRQLRSLAYLRNSSTAFAQARSTAPGTTSSLASTFINTYFSQQYWAPSRGAGELYEEMNPRLSEILNQAGVTTVTFTGVPVLTPRYQLLRGFTESKDMQDSARYAKGDVIMTAALARLQRVANEPFFLYLHLLDAHWPYDRGLKTGAPFDRYLSELQFVDREVGRLIQLIQSKPWRHRTLLIVSADHGEAFGEHRTWNHSSTIYDELLRVPLIMWIPGRQKLVVDEPVTLLDVAPTILDVFGLPTPGHFMGQSLVPFLRGEKPRLTRPILAEGRLKQALILPDGHKVIVDNRLNTVELYDLRNDPHELKSLADDEERLSTPLSLIRQFFQVHTNRTPGYTPPYRIW